jgi:hypothetical protein
MIIRKIAIKCYVPGNTGKKYKRGTSVRTNNPDNPEFVSFEVCSKTVRK